MSDDIAGVEIDPSADLPAIAAAAGNDAMEARWYADGKLYVRGVTQEALEAAAAAISAVPPSVPVPVSVSRVAFLREAARLGIITREEALAAAKTGDVPASFEPILTELPVDAAFEARLAFAATPTIERASPLLALIIGPHGIPASVMDDLFRAAGAG